MINRYNHNGLIWIDLESPTKEELQELSREFNLRTHVVHELQTPTMKPRVDVFDNFMYLVLHFPALKRSHQSLEQEVDFIIGKDFLITTRYENVDTFQKFENLFKLDTNLKDGNFDKNAMSIFIPLVKRLYKSVEYEIDQIRKELDTVEKEIFDGHEKEMVAGLSHIGRDVLDLKQALDPHQDILKSLEKETPAFAGEEYKYRIRNLEDTYYRARKHTIHLWQTLSELRETNNSLLSTKQNEVMKFFTILAFVTFPLTLFTSVFGMNTKHTPVVGAPHDFWIIIIIMSIITIAMFAYFIYKKWL